LVLINVSDMQAPDLASHGAGAKFGEGAGEDDLVSGASQHLLKRLVLSVQLPPGSEAEPVLQLPNQECRCPAPSDVGILPLEQAQTLRDGFNRRIQVCRSREVLAQGQDIGRPGVGVVETHGQALDRSNVVLANLGNLGLNLQNYNIETIGRPAFHE
jgi:hypothetical protein